MPHRLLATLDIVKKNEAARMGASTPWTHCRGCHGAMIFTGPAVKMFVATDPITFRKGHDGLQHWYRATCVTSSLTARAMSSGLRERAG